MSDKYIEINNRNSGAIIIDDNVMRLRNVRTFKASSGTDISYSSLIGWERTGNRNPETEVHGVATVNIPLNNNESVVAVRMVGSAIDEHYCVSVDIYGGKIVMYAYYIGVDIDGANLLDKLSNTIVYTFGNVTPVDDHCGMMIYDAGGQPIFSSADKLLNVVSNYRYYKEYDSSKGPKYWTELTKVVTDNINYAFVVGSLRGQIINISTSVIFVGFMIFAINYSSHGIREQGACTFWTISGIKWGFPGSGQANLLLIDVSNIQLPQ